MERAYLETFDGDARDTLRRALGDALMELATVSSQFSRGFVRAQRPADLSRLGRLPPGILLGALALVRGHDVRDPSFHTPRL